MYQHVFLNHLKLIQDWLQGHDATATVLLPNAVLRVQSGARVVDFQPQYIVRGQDKKVTMWFELNEQTTGFAGWLPYFNKRWPEATNKLLFKAFAKKHGLRTPQYFQTPGSYENVIIKRDRSSFAEGMRGPFRRSGADVPLSELGDGEYYEQFVLGRNLKAWFWNGKPVCAELSAMASICGNGQHSVRELLASAERFTRRFVDEHMLECMVAYQGFKMDDVLAEGQQVYVDYRHGTPLNKVDLKNNDILARMDAALRDQLEHAGRILEQAIPVAIRPNTAFSLDGIVDEQNQVWLLEMNCNPGLHPAAYPAILDSVLHGPPLSLPQENLPQHLASVGNKTVPVATPSVDSSAIPIEALPRPINGTSKFSSKNTLLFGAPISTLRWETEAGFNERLSEALLDLHAKKLDGKFTFNKYNLWREDIPELNILKDMFLQGINAYLDAHCKEDIRHNFDYAMHAWLRLDKPKQLIPPHTHPDASLVATYYSKADIAMRKAAPTGYGKNVVTEGDLVLKDTSAVGNSTFLKSSSIFSVAPEPGLMVIIPNHLLHWVNPVSEGDVRISIANNLMFVKKNSIGLRGSFEINQNTNDPLGV